ncbi:MAG TPA: hypothetical protein V6D02_01025 [Candidatus Obscuribacterales bacterium]
MINPIFWLVLSFLLVSVSLTAVLVVLVPAVRELSRAARSVEKLCDTLNRDLPPTLESIRLTSAEITSLTDDLNAGVQNATHVAQQVDESMTQVRGQAKRVQIGTRTLMAGINAALTTLMQSPRPTAPRTATPATPRRPAEPAPLPPAASADTPVTTPAPPLSGEGSQRSDLR